MILLSYHIATMYSFKKFSAALVIFSVALFFPSSNALPCIDDPEYTFGKTVAGVTRTCSWLAAGPLKRLERWCFGAINPNPGSNPKVTIRQKCRLTCGACGGPVKPGCSDFPGWTDEIGEGCTWYAVGRRCEIWGNGYAGADGFTAKDACCQCGGGRSDPPADIDNSETSIA